MICRIRQPTQSTFFPLSGSYFFAAHVRNPNRGETDVQTCDEELLGTGDDQVVKKKKNGVGCVIVLGLPDR